MSLILIANLILVIFPLSCLSHVHCLSEQNFTVFYSVVCKKSASQKQINHTKQPKLASWGEMGFVMLNDSSTT